jgi:hypothetical protein
MKPEVGSIYKELKVKLKNTAAVLIRSGVLSIV